MALAATALSGGSGGPRTEINPTLCTAWAWKRLAARAQLQYLYAPRLPLAAHLDISAAKEPAAIKALGAVGITQLGDLYKQGQFRSLSDIQSGRDPGVHAQVHLCAGEGGDTCYLPRLPR